MTRTLRRAGGLDVLYVGTLPPHQGGTAVANSQILCGLARRGHRVRAVAPITEEALRGGDRYAAATPELEVIRFTLPYLDTSPDTPPASSYLRHEGREIARHMNALIAERRPDVVIVGRESFGWHVPGVAEAHGVPSLIVIHGATTIGIVSGSYPRALAEGLLERLRRVDVVCTPAHHLAETLRGLGLPTVDVIRNPVDLDRFEPGPRDPRLAAELGLEADDVVVAHLSNMKALKRPLDLVESARAALAQEPRLRYLVVGDGNVRDATARRVAELGLSERFRFVGWVDYERVPDHVRLADVVAMPSAAETQALVYLETQACGRTLVASDVPGAREVVVDGRTGLLFPVGDVEALTATIVRAAQSPGLREAIGRNAREAALTHALPAVVDEYEQLLVDLAAGAARRARSRG